MNKHCCIKPGGCCHVNNEFIKSDTYENCVYHAFYDENDKKYSHQHRITRYILDAYKNKLLPIENEFKTCKNFDEVYKLFKEHRIPGIGNLTIYDVALRVSQNYGIYPDKVYLHAGTTKGALNAGLIKKFSRKDTLTISEITEKLQWLKDIEPHIIEDFLCVCKDNISEKNLKIYLKK